VTSGVNEAVQYHRMLDHVINQALIVVVDLTDDVPGPHSSPRTVVQRHVLIVRRAVTGVIELL
jgi:hypothetical protein